MKGAGSDRSFPKFYCQKVHLRSHLGDIWRGKHGRHNPRLYLRLHGGMDFIVPRHIGGFPSGHPPLVPNRITSTGDKSVDLILYIEYLFLYHRDITDV